MNHPSPRRSVEPSLRLVSSPLAPVEVVSEDPCSPVYPDPSAGAPVLDLALGIAVAGDLGSGMSAGLRLAEGVLADADRVTQAVAEGQLVLGQAALRPLDPEQVERVERWLDGSYRQGRAALARLREEVHADGAEATAEPAPSRSLGLPAPRRGDGDVSCAG